VENLKTKQTSELDTDGVFVFVGMVPRTELLKGVVPLDRWGCVETDDSMQTSVPGLFAAGDIRAKEIPPDHHRRGRRHYRRVGCAEVPARNAMKRGHPLARALPTKHLRAELFNNGGRS